MAEKYVVFESHYKGNNETGEVNHVIKNVIRKVKDNYVKNCAKAMRKAVLVVERDAKACCPVYTGNLRNSIQSTVEIEENENVVGYVGSNEEYAPYVHQGTGIYARDGNGRKEIPWVYKDAKGNYHSTKGIQPTPFIEMAIQNNQDVILRYFKAVLTDD